MGERYHRLFDARGWFSRFARVPGWFKETVAADTVTVDLDVTEPSDSAAFVTTQVAAADLVAIEPSDAAGFTVLVIPPGVVLAVLDATEPTDTAAFAVTVPRRRRPEPPLASAGDGAGFVKPKPPPITARLAAVEASDRFGAFVRVLDAPPIVPGPLPSPELPVFPRQDAQLPMLGRRPVETEPLPPVIVAPIMARLKAAEQPDRMRAKITATDVIAIDNAFLLLT